MENKKSIISLKFKFFGVAIVCIAILLSLSVYSTRNSLTKLNEELISARLFADINHIRDIIGKGEWNVKDNTLYHGDVIIGDGTEEKANLAPFLECEEKTGTFSYTFIKCPDEGLTWTGDDKTGYQQGHFLRAAGSTLGPRGESIIGTYMDKKVADVLDERGVYLGPANVNGRQIYCVYETLVNGSGEVVGAVVVGRSIAEMEGQISDSIKQNLMIYALGLTLAMLLIVIIINPVIKGVNDTVSYLKIVGEGKFPESRLDVNTNDEMSVVADSINDMVESLKEKELLTRFRENVHKSAIISFCANIDKNLVIEGAQNFPTLREEDGSLKYDKLIDFVTDNIVDPEHRDMIRSHMSADSLETQIATAPEMEITYKVMVDKMLKYASMSPEIGKALQGSGKQLSWLASKIVLLRNPDGELLCYQDIMDVDQQMINAEKIRLMAMNDPLTGLLNRGSFEDSLAKVLSKEGASGALFMLDLDHFKEVNDNLGHPAGDELLKITARTIHRIFRDDDIICRLGGDEFCAFAKGFTDYELLRKRAEELKDKGHRYYPAKDGKTIKVSFSVGISLYPYDAKDIKDLYNCADKALYEAKEAGRDCYRFFGHK